VDRRGRGRRGAGDRQLAAWAEQHAEIERVLGIETK
jgi:hypothetical protein